MDQIPSRPRSSGFHVLIISLLFIILLGTLSMLGILITRPTPTPVAHTSETCQAQVDQATAQAESACVAQATAQQNSPATLSVPSRDGSLGFSYPSGWSALVGNNISEGPKWYAQLTAGYIVHCDACEGPMPDITMVVDEKTKLISTNAPDLHTYIATQYSDPSYSDIQIVQTTDVGGERYTITGSMNGLLSGNFETIYFEGPTRYATITFFDNYPTDTDTNEAWTIVKDSLDFSGIQN